MKPDLVAAKGIAPPALPIAYHGGNLAEAEALFPGARKPWIDLSTGINPEAYPVGPLTDAAFRRLPAPADLEALERAASRRYCIGAGAAIIAAAGTQTLLSAIALTVPKSRVAVIGPTYAEHARAWRAAGHEVSEVSSIDEIGKATVVVLVLPNNPDGRIVPPETVTMLENRAREMHGLLIVDEAFADLLEAPSSAIAGATLGKTIVLRSFGKTYGLAGIRLAFAISTPDIIERLRSHIGPWPVSGPAIEIGRQALTDDDWLLATRRHVTERSDAFAAILRGLGFYVLDGALLFCLIDDIRAPDLFNHLGRHGIFVRRFQSQPRWLRIGLPPEDSVTRERIEAAFRNFHRTA